VNKIEPAQRAHKFQTLDALRGLAAMVVVILHNDRLFGFRVQHGYLAVDMFFALSGFVLSYAYQSRLDSGMSSLAFLKARAIRLAPLYFLALALGCFVVLLTGEYTSFHLSRAQYIEYGLLGTLLLPARNAPCPFPYNNPSWTLFLEFAMNAAHALFLRRRKTLTLTAIWASSGAALVIFYMRSHNLNAGWLWDGLFTVGLARVVFSYTAGMLIYRLWLWRKNLVEMPSLLVSGLTLIMLVIPTPHEAFVSLLMIFFLVPIIVYCGAATEPKKGFQRIFGLLGGASYSIYVLHSPFFVLGIWMLRGHTINSKLAAWMLLAALIAISILVDNYYDLPVRRRLRLSAKQRVAIPSDINERSETSQRAIYVSQAPQ
jgi:peptidoglycan/LPS O-acetylase OafA/YrhL